MHLQLSPMINSGCLIRELRTPHPSECTGHWDPLFYNFQFKLQSYMLHPQLT